MKRTRQLIAVALVATALCADRAVAAAPEVRTEGSIASRIASRITTGLRRAVSSIRIYEPRQETRGLRPLAASRIDNVSVVVVHPTLSPFESRLPPPAL
jgi:hypothetical protein